MKPKIPSFDALIQNHGICLATEGRSQNTIDWYASNLTRFLQFLRNRQLPDSVKDIGVSEVRNFIFYLQNEVTRWESSPHTKDERRLSISFCAKMLPLDQVKIQNQARPHN